MDFSFLNLTQNEVGCLHALGRILHAKFHQNLTSSGNFYDSNNFESQWSRLLGNQTILS